MSLVDRIRGELKKAHTRAVRHGWSAGARRTRAAQKALAPAAPPPPAPVVTYPGVAAARAQSETGHPFLGEGMCLAYVHDMYGIGAGNPDAIAAWNSAKVKHRETDPVKIPRGYPVFWSGGSAGHGHIAISAGSGFCWSTDIKRTGFFDRVPIDQIRAQWGLTLLGWTEDLNGSVVPARVVK